MGQCQNREPREGTPRSYYLVFGAPPIRYTGEPSCRGPLIFNVVLDEADDEGKERAETLNLPVAVQSKQPFKLTQVNANNKKHGFIFSFSLSFAGHAAPPGYSLRILAGVDIEYREGEGIRLTQAEKSNSPFCVFECSSSDGLSEEVTATEPIYLQSLKNVVVSAMPDGAKRLTYAPIVIELEYDPNAANGGTHKSRRNREELEETELIEHTVHYTFLDLPDTNSQPTTTGTSEGSGGAPAKPVVETKVVRQMLQYGSEVYELDDVFGLTNDDADEEDGEDTLCIVCFTNLRDTMLLPCRHMCLCYECASMLRLQRNNACPVCRINIERIMRA
ncbi:hypothetical protein TRVL_08900 [Trypanosoma vivax]|nr:hypothetical protein TRVL_08900 [Trypanosoma vivax]